VETAIRGFGATNALGCKLFSDQPSLIAGAKTSAKRGHVGDEWRNDDAVPPAPPFRMSPSFAMPFATEISDSLSLSSLQPTASPALASEPIASSSTLVRRP
jgi:hypothetical protein